MIFERTYDMDLVKTIITNPKCFGQMANDSAPPREKLECVDRSGTLPIIARNDDGILAGVFLLVSIVPHVAEVHFCLLPSAWGQGDKIGEEFLEWAWKGTSLNTLRGPVPAYNRLALKTALACGFRISTVTDDAVQRGGKLYAMIHTVIERPQ